MENVIEIKDDVKKEWIAPELDEIEVQQITAFNSNSPGDLGGNSVS